MRRRMLNKLIVQAFRLDLLICLITFFLQQIDAQFKWIFMATLVVFFWLCIAGICSILDFLVNEDER